MSISDKITRLATAHDDIAAAIATKGGTVNTGDGFEDFAADIATIPQTGGTQPTLHAPTITRSGNKISVSNPSTNGNYAAGFKIYDGDTYVDYRASQSQFYVTSLGVGSYSLSVALYGTNFNDSPKSNVINASVYTIARSLTNLTTTDNTSLISDGETYTLTLAPASGYYLPSSISVTIGGTATSSFTYDATTGIVSIPNVSGNVSITAVAADQPPVVAYPIYGVSGLYSSSPALTRTDDAVGMSYVINSSSGAVVSDFDNVFPWSETEIVNDDAGKFVSFPEMYIRIGRDSSNRLTDVAVSKEPSGTGTWVHVAPFMMSCYGGSVSSNKLKSVSGVARQANTPYADFLTYATANGEKYTLVDLFHYNVLMALWWIEFATKDSASIMTGRISGSGTSGGNTAVNTGGTDGLTTPSGFETAYAQMRYHNIEDLVGNLWNFTAGWYKNNVGEYDYVTDNPAAYALSTTGKSAMPFVNPANGEIAAFGVDPDHPLLFIPCETVQNDNYDTYFCDRIYHGSGNPLPSFGAYYLGASALFGLSCSYAYYASLASAYYGSRLLKLS